MELNIQLLANSCLTYAKISGVSNAESIINNNILRLASNGITFTLSYLINRFNEDEVQDAIERYTNIVGTNKMRLDFLYPVPNNEFYSERFVDVMYDRKKAFRRVDAVNFCQNEKIHNCYGNQIAITAEGNVLPCIMSRQLTLGNVKDQGIVSILANSKYEDYRKLTKNSIQECKECAYRYGCFDCRALEMSATGDVKGLEYCNLKPDMSV